VTVDYREFYRGRAVMITGGLGFIGSNLARALVDLGARVLLVDSLIPDYGGNLFNVDGLADRVTINVADIRQQSTMNYLVRDRDVIFSLAGQVSHIDSMRDPSTDLEINCRSQLTVLEACRSHNPRVKVVFAGTRQVCGKPESLPVDETHLVRPTDVNGINKAAGELPSRLQQRFWRARLLAAADQHLRTAAADQNTTARASSRGSSGSRSKIGRFRSTATVRSCATSSTSRMRPTRFCAPAPAMPSTARSSTSAAPSRSASVN
jgi:hypothetical protein